MSIFFSDNSSSRSDPLNTSHGINPSPMSISSQSISSSEHLPWPPELNRRNTPGLRQWILWLPRYFLRLLNVDGPDSEFDGLNVPVENEVAMFFQTFLSVGALSIILVLISVIISHLTFPFDFIWPFTSHFNEAPIAVHHETGLPPPGNYLAGGSLSVPIPFFGDQIAFAASPFQFLDKLQRTHGSIASARLLGRDWLVLSGHELLKSIHPSMDINISTNHYDVNIAQSTILHVGGSAWPQRLEQLLKELESDILHEQTIDNTLVNRTTISDVFTSDSNQSQKDARAEIQALLEYHSSRPETLVFRLPEMLTTINRYMTRWIRLKTFKFVDEARLLATDLGLQLLLGRVERPTAWTLGDNPIEVEVDGLTVEVCFRLMKYLNTQR